MIRRISAVMLCVLLFIVSSSMGESSERLNDVVILFTNDVHCGIDENIGYAGLSAYKKEMGEKYRYTLLVDCGDFSQGDFMCAISKGEYPVALMNAAGYDYAIFGNHEFDYGPEVLRKNVRLSDARFLNCNVTYTGSGDDWIGRESVPYEIREFGNLKVALIGVATPRTIMCSSPSRFTEDGQIVYDFCQGKDPQSFYDTVQGYVTECRQQGADYVIVLSHLGMDVEYDSPYTSFDLARNTSGIDVILDGHSHTEASCMIRQNKEGAEVLLSSTGTRLSKIGKLVLCESGTVTVGFIDSYEKKDPAIEAFIAEIRSSFEDKLDTVIAHTDAGLSYSDSSGIRMVRTREVALGDFVADAFRVISGADIGMCNGGGIRAELKAGDITYQDLISVNPNGNSLCVVKVTGAEILDMLEYFYRHVQSVYQKDGLAFSEDGSFQQVSGIRFTVDTSVESSVETDENDLFLRVTGARRVSDVMILKDGVYTPIDPSAVYTLASHNYMIKLGGSGMLNFLADHELTVDEAIADYQVLIDYAALLGGDLSAYADVDSRIIVK